MTISSTNRIAGPYTGTGVQVVFPFSFKIFVATDLLVYLTNTASGVVSGLVYSADYSVTLNANQDANPGGYITAIVAPSTTSNITITSQVRNTQPADLTNAGNFYPKTINDSFDRATIQIQQLQLSINNALRLPVTAPAGTSGVLPFPVANKLLGWDASGQSLINYTPTGAAIPTNSAIILRSVSDLGTTTAVADQTIEVAAYLSTGRYGGGYFRGVASGALVIDNVTVFASASAGIYWQRLNPTFLDPFMAGATGVAAADTIAIATCLTVLRANGRGGVLTIPPGIAGTATVASLALSAGMSIAVIDQRFDRTGGVQAFGVIEYYLEARDGGGGYATEFRVSGKQNPGFSLYPRSDGTAPGYSIANHMTSIVSFTNAGDNNVQYLTDPFSHGRKGTFAFEQYSAGAFTVSLAAYFGVDNNNKTRVDITPINLVSTPIAITSISNTTPIIITTTVPHTALGAVTPIGILGSAVAALNGTSWEAQVTGANTLSLLGSTALGAGGAGGTVGIQKNAQRATFNVPSVQGGIEAIVGEGRIVATGTNGVLVSEVAQGTAPISAASQTVDVNLHANPNVMNINGAQVASGTPGSGYSKIVTGTAVLVAGTKTVTLTGNAVFNSTSTYKVSGSNGSTTNTWGHTKVSGSSITFTGTGTDQIDFQIIGF